KQIPVWCNASRRPPGPELSDRAARRMGVGTVAFAVISATLECAGSEARRTKRACRRPATPPRRVLPYDISTVVGPRLDPLCLWLVGRVSRGAGRAAAGVGRAALGAKAAIRRRQDARRGGQGARRD